VIGRVLADGRITPEEYQEVYRAVEAVLPFEDRQRAFAARQQVETAEAVTREPGANGVRIGWIAVALGLATAAATWLAVWWPAG